MDGWFLGSLEFSYPLSGINIKDVRLQGKQEEGRRWRAEQRLTYRVSPKNKMYPENKTQLRLSARRTHLVGYDDVPEDDMIVFE